tara:strand:- start:3011 stop:3364 length:354 start_codon:yes stop_codon:yes gene_type:complete
MQTLEKTTKLNHLEKIKRLVRVFLLTLFTLIFSNLSLAEQKNSFDIPDKPSIKFLALETTIVGNKEQPKVISIVPWQTPAQHAITAKAITSEIQLVFRPIEIESLQKELQYFNRQKK